MAAPAMHYKVERGADGSVTVRLNQGECFTLTAAGTCADLILINAVGIKHVDQVASHTINTIAGSRSHVIHFVNGSFLNYAYSSDGQLIELAAQKSRMPHIAGQRMIVLYLLRNLRCAKSSA
jgi:hypothetical protein